MMFYDLQKDAKLILKLPYYDFGPRTLLKMLYQNVKHRPTKYQAGLLLLHFILNIQSSLPLNHT